MEDYLETILQLIDGKGYARVADIAEALGIAQPSVSNMVQRLDEKGLINHEKYRGMTLTEEGNRLARRIVKRHKILEQFLDLLGVDPQVAHEDLEGIEHHMSSETVRGIEQLMVELQNDGEMRERVRNAVREG